MYGAGDFILQPVWDWLVNECGFITASAAFPGAMALTFYYIGAIPFCIADGLNCEMLRKYVVRHA